MGRPSVTSRNRATWLVLATVGTLVAGSALALGGCRQAGTNRSAVIRCTPGERVDVSCGCLGLGSVCEGDAGIRLCDAALANGACGEAQAVTSTDGRQVCDDGCPLATTFCPASGLLAVTTFARPNVLDETGPYACAWAVRRTPTHPGPSATFACIPGERVQASCGCEGLGRWCEGDPILRACAPGVACATREDALAQNDDTCGRCPWVEAICPASGAIVFATAPVSSGSRYRCELGAIGADGRALAPTGI
ncbi:MAG: hypothetical protein OHK0013_46830 [Sandaracinaceae bacterium]